MFTSSSGRLNLSALIIMMLATLQSGRAAAAPTPDPDPLSTGQPQIAAPAPIHPQLAGQLHSFAPYVSFKNRLTPGDATVAQVLEELTLLKEFKDNTFDADPLLQRASRNVVSFLVLSLDRVTPELRDARIVPPLPVDLPEEYVFGLAVLELFAEAARHQAIGNWMADYDVKCRDASRDLLPLLRRVAKGTPATAAPVRIESTFSRDKGVHLVAINETGQSLKNVTLSVMLSTIDGDSRHHFYFLPEWPASKPKYPLRIAMDWPIGARGTTHAVVELLSDEVVASSVRCAIDDNVPTAADLLLPRIEEQLRRRKSPKTARDRLKLMMPALTGYPDRAEQRAALEVQANTILKDETDRIDTLIGRETDRLVNLRKERTAILSRKAGPARVSALERNQKSIDAAEAKISTLKSERADWLSGKR